VTKEITTLGRGGSDTTAVALAAALGRVRCEILTDVDGVYTADPRVVPRARLVPRMGYRACSALAHLGGRVLHARCVDLAARERVPVEVRSAFHEAQGTSIMEDTVEAPKVEAVTHRRRRLARDRRGERWRQGRGARHRRGGGGAVPGAGAGGARAG
jgi:aspartate kinase